MSTNQRILKELFDRTAAVILLALTLPLCLFAALLIKLSSRGPVLFTQGRIGRDGRPFRIYKFRTMHLRRSGQPDSTVTTNGDARIFFAGGLLRKWKIDELPQLFNILNGTMSLVGPRPTVAEDYQRMDENQRRRLLVKPGLTGLAQIRGNTSLSWPKRIEHDLAYAERQSLWLDLEILAVTAFLVFTFRAETHPPGDDEWVDAPMPRLVCVGSNLESEVVLRKLVQGGASIAGLVTLPRTAAAGVSDYVDLHDFCRDHAIRVIDAADINAPHVLAAIAQLRPDYIYTLGWSQLFGKELLDIPTQFVVGSHPSPLPKGRGRAPAPWTVLQDCRKSAVTLFRMRAGVDSGPILVQNWFAVPEAAYVSEVYRLISENLSDAFCELYRAHCSGETIKDRVQDESRATYRCKRTAADGHIDFDRPAAEIERLIRAVSQPFPGAYTYYAGQKVQIWRASLANVPAYSGTIGQILWKDCERLLVQALDRPLWLSDFSVNDKIATCRRFRVGDKFGYALEDEIHDLRSEVRELKLLLKKVTETKNANRDAA